MEIMTYLKEETLFFVVIIWTCDLIFPQTLYIGKIVVMMVNYCDFWISALLILLKAIPDLDSLVWVYVLQGALDCWRFIAQLLFLFTAATTVRTKIYIELICLCWSAIWNHGRLAIWLLGTKNNQPRKIKYSPEQNQSESSHDLNPWVDFPSDLW